MTSALHAMLTAEHTSQLEKEIAVTKTFANILSRLSACVEPDGQDLGRIGRAVEFIRDNWAEKVSRSEIFAASDFSAAHLIRVFKPSLGMTAHVYIVNRCIQKSREHLRAGASLVDAALLTGFCDQAHFQRTCKRLTGATPVSSPGRGLSLLRPTVSR